MTSRLDQKAMAKLERLADEEGCLVDELLYKIGESEENFQAYVRALYGQGYVDALKATA